MLTYVLYVPDQHPRNVSLELVDFLTFIYTLHVAFYWATMAAEVDVAQG